MPVNPEIEIRLVNDFNSSCGSSSSCSIVLTTEGDRNEQSEEKSVTAGSETVAASPAHNVTCSEATTSLAPRLKSYRSRVNIGMSSSELTYNHQTKQQLSTTYGFYQHVFEN